MTDSSKAVFLSYASQDAEAAKRICDALRAAGVEVWFDQSELRGGDAWDRKIRKQIHDCALFIPVISRTTQGRVEGYFRREWKLAVDRTHDMSDRVAFLVPVVIDDTGDAEADVPEAFRAVHWTRLPAGENALAFVEHVARLLLPEPSHDSAEVTSPVAAAARNTRAAPLPPAHSPAASRPTPRGLLLIAAVVVFGLGYFAVDKFFESKRPEAGTRASVVAGAAISSAIPEKSVAVLPFADMSEKHDQEYFSDGLSEELIDMLSKVPDLRVPARTSSFYFKGKNEKIGDIAKELRVANLLEGSVRKAGNRLRVTAQLIRADNGYHLWSQTYDRDASDIFKVQDEIAEAVVKALSISLMKGSMPQSAKASNTAAYGLYLQGRSLLGKGGSLAEFEQAVIFLQQALKLDSEFAPTWAALSRAQLVMYVDFRIGSGGKALKDAFESARRAVTLDPNLPDGHMVLARVLEARDWDWAAAEREMNRALELGSANPTVLRNAAYQSETMGRSEEAVSRTKTASELDPLSGYNYMQLGHAQFLAQRPAEAESSYRTAAALRSDVDGLHSGLAMALLAQAKNDEALVEAEKESDPAQKVFTLPIVLDALGRRTDADRAQADAEAKFGTIYPYDIGLIHAARRDLTHAFEWWERAFRQHETTFAYSIKLAPVEARLPELTTDPRYRALLRKMNLPE